jgi:hypothetical protein
MREMSIETDHLIETYRRAGAYITRFGDELEAFDIQLNNINIGRWCSYCSNKKLCGKCDLCHNKSFSSLPFLHNISY